MIKLTPKDLELDSIHIDELLGIKVKEIEHQFYLQAQALNPQGNHHTWGASIHQGHQTWVGLDPETIQTPYPELKEICQKLNPFAGSRVIDLGAGYGRLGLILNLLYPEVDFLGLEYVSERVEEGQRIFAGQGCLRAKLLSQDLAALDFELPVGDYYFIYDYGTLAHQRHTLRQIEKLADHKTFKVVARGEGIRSLISKEHPWLAHVFEPYHTKNYSIYSMSSSG